MILTLYLAKAGGGGLNPNIFHTEVTSCGT